MRISICLLVSVLLLGCSPGEDRNALNSQAFREKYESVWYSPEIREQYLEALQESNIPYFEREMEYSSQLYIHTERKYSEDVSRIKKGLFGTPPGEFSVSFVDKSVQAQAAAALTEAGIEVQTMSAYGNSYITWNERDAKLADEILLSKFSYDRQRSREAARSHNK